MSSTASRPNPDTARAKPDVGTPKPDNPSPRPASPPLRDGLMRLIGIPFFGLVIPRWAGLFGPLGWHGAWYWAGTVWFVFLAFCIWQGNRWLLLQQRARVHWFYRPLLKLALLVLANVFYTAPVTIALLAAWYAAAPLPGLDWAAIKLVALTNVIAVLFVTHAYETVFLIKEREDDLLRIERTERSRLLAELESMKAQLAPHFLFNCLNTLAALIEESPVTAAQFNQHLADVCRYLLQQKNRDLVPLADELKFFQSYVALTRLRFTDSVDVRLTGFDNAANWLVPPAALQLLLENAIKHNKFDGDEPLVVEVNLAGGWLTMRNVERPKFLGQASPGVGLKNLRERLQLITGGELQVTRTDGYFNVRLPAAPLSHAQHSGH